MPTGGCPMSGLKRVETMSGKENQKIIGDGDQVSRMLNWKNPYFYWFTFLPRTAWTFWLRAEVFLTENTFNWRKFSTPRRDSLPWTEGQCTTNTFSLSHIKVSLSSPWILSKIRRLVILWGFFSSLRALVQTSSIWDRLCAEFLHGSRGKGSRVPSSDCWGSARHSREITRKHCRVSRVRRKQDAKDNQ